MTSCAPPIRLDGIRNFVSAYDHDVRPETLIEKYDIAMAECNSQLGTACAYGDIERVEELAALKEALISAGRRLGFEMTFRWH